MPTVQIFGKNKCFDTKKALRYFKERQISVQFIDLTQKNMSKGELRSVKEAVGGFDKLLNEKSANAALVKYLAYEEDIEEKFLSDSTLFKTPIVRCGKLATVGYCPDEWKRLGKNES